MNKAFGVIYPAVINEGAESSSVLAVADKNRRGTRMPLVSKDRTLLRETNSQEMSTTSNRTGVSTKDLVLIHSTLIRLAVWTDILQNPE